MLNLQSILGKRFQKSGIAKSITAALVCEKFDELMFKQFGDVFGKRVSAARFKQGVLVIKIPSSVFSQEIKLHEREVIEAINHVLGKDVVKRLSFLV